METNGGSSGDSARRVEIILTEYRALRDEILLCLERRTTIISYGLAGAGALAAAGAAALERSSLADSGAPLLAGLIFLAAAIAALYILWFWFAETQRARRASQYLLGLEKDVNSALGEGKPALRWEHWLRGSPRQSFNFHYWLTLSFFWLAALAFFGAALASVWSVPHLLGPAVRCFVLPSAAVLGFAALAVVLRLSVTTILRLERDFDQEPW